LIECLVYKCESYDSDNFKKRLDQYSPNSILLLYNYRSGVMRGNKRVFTYRNNLFWNFAGVFFLLLYYCLRYRPRVLIVENTYDMAFIGIVRRLGLVKHLVYLCGDWLLNPFFPFLDFLACKYSDIVWDSSERIKEARFCCWNRSICKKEFIYKLGLEKKQVNPGFKNKVLFMGEARKDSGIDVALANKLYKVKVLPFTKREDFKKEFSDCFCGINLITSKRNYSGWSFPSKILEYLQHRLPVIITEGCGDAPEIIRKNKLGLVIKPTVYEFEEALLKINRNYLEFLDNIDSFIEKSPYLSIEELITGKSQEEFDREFSDYF
jgi:hypothetical protein